MTTKTKNEYDAYVIKDNYGMYAGDITRRSDTYVYSYSTRLGNGFFTYPSIESAEFELNLIVAKASEFGLDRQFHLEEINLKDIIQEEGKLPENKYPIEYIENELSVAVEECVAV